MSYEDVLTKLNVIFNEVFDDNEIVISDTTTAKDIDRWDSLMHINLISEIEDVFDIHFSMKDVMKMTNVGEMVRKIMELTR